MTFRSPKLLKSSNGQVCVRCGKTEPIWRSVLGFEDLYEVSDQGQTRSLRSGKTITPNLAGKGPYAQLHLYRNGIRTLMYVHHAVLLAFVGQRPFPEAEACHGLLGCLHNCVENLRWGTRQSNLADIVICGSQCGEKNPGAKLTAETVRSIRLRRSNGEDVYSIARDYGISSDYIYTIASRKAWSHIP